MIEALILDFDGTIIDTETPDYQSWLETYQSFAVELQRSLWSRYIGGGDNFDTLAHLEELTGRPVDRERVRQERRRRYLELVEAEPLLPGVMDYLLEARQLGLKLGVASSSSRDWVEGHLRKRELFQHFASVKSADDVSRVKPDPELYLASATHLGVSPGNALAIEDSANGVVAAKRAGLFCVVVPNEMTRGMRLERADARLSSLSEVPLGELLERLGWRRGDQPVAPTVDCR